MYDLKAIGERIAKAKERLRKGEVVETAIPLPREDEQKEVKKGNNKPNGKKVPARVLAGCENKKSENIKEKLKAAKAKLKEEEALPPSKLRERKKEELKKKSGPSFFVPEDTPDRVGGLSPIQLSVIAYCFLNQDKRGVAVATLIEKLLSEEERAYHSKRKVSDGPQRIIRNALRAPVRRGFLVRTLPGHYTFAKPKPGRDGKVNSRDAEVSSFLVEFKRQYLKKKF